MIQPIAATLGYAAYDEIHLIHQYPASGAKTQIASTCHCPGGQAASAAVALARWGLPIRFIGRLGDDSPGRLCMEVLGSEGVDISSAIITPNTRTQRAVIFVEQDSAERTIFWRRDPALNLLPIDIQPQWLQTIKALLIDGHETSAALVAAQQIKAQGGVVILDAEEIGSQCANLLQYVDICIGAADFGKQEFGISDSRSVIRHIKSMGPAVAGLTLGGEGVLVDWGEGPVHLPGIKVPVLDTTGAGDIFHAGVLYSVLSGWDWEKCFQFANIVAGLSCRRFGGQDGIPALREAVKFLDCALNGEDHEFK